MSSLSATRHVVVVLLSLACVAFTLSACGPFGGGSPEDALEDLKDAAKDGDEGKICELYTDQVKDRLDEFGSCEDTFADAPESDLEYLSDFDVKETEEEGDEATATIERDGVEREVPMKKEDGDWKIDEFFRGVPTGG